MTSGDDEKVDSIRRAFEHPGFVLTEADVDRLRQNLLAIMRASQWLTDDKIARLATEALALVTDWRPTP
jgi:hypothetical protein